jgi:hypothetical protein
MLIDNCPAHPKDYPKLKKFIVHFFPSNVTSRCHLMDMGIIDSLKCN